MKLIGTELAKSDISAAAEAAKEFLGKIAGPAAEEVGLLLQDKVRIYRLGNQLKMLAKAQQMLNDAGVSPISVPLRTLLPLLEGAALEEEDDLSTKWATLLANAATPDSPVDVYPSFPHILSQLSPRDARVLDAIYDLALRLGLRPGQWAERGGTRESIMKVMGMSPEEFDLVTDNLIRLGLCSGQGMRLSFIDKKDQVFQLKDKGIISITQLGYEFVTACRQPPKKVT
ncbi:MAG TPA: Abi-alpha family protein [Fervidobacterium sp.]|nr:Abi-alpha family protein [Fervidobacterium sp.]